MAGWSVTPNVVPPRPATEDDLTFVRRPMVDWLHPAQLAMTAVKTMLSIVFGAYADKRELQAALNSSTTNEPFDYSKEKELWVDFVADSGDGFDSTYAVAWLASHPLLTVTRPDGTSDQLPRAHVLIQGGDEVYPTASAQEYQNRFEGPYRAALPWVNPPAIPHMYAIPGNHDWYDGLTSFIRLFCQDRWIGGWKTRQQRSYFALKLPHDWWLFAIDLQLESDVDEPQKAYFESIVHNHLQPHSRVILCTAEPNWVHCGSETPDDAVLVPPGSAPPPRARRHMAARPSRFKNLAYFETRVLAMNGIRHVVTLSGDLHHYTRYAGIGERPKGGSMASVAEQQQVQRITAGGGGAYLYPTHHMAERLELTELDSTKAEVTRRYALKRAFPDPEQSRRLSGGILALVYRNKAFAALLAAIYLLTIWVLQSASKASYGFFLKTGWGSLIEWGAERPSFPDFLSNCFLVLQHSPSGVVLVAAVIAGLAAFAYSEPERWYYGLWGGVHGLAHVAVAALLVWTVGQGTDVSSLIPFLRFVVLTFVGGWLIGGFLFSVYLLLSSWLFCLHLNEVFSAQRIPHYKCFVRMHIAENLTIYPIGLKRTPSWKVGADPQHPDAWLTPNGTRPEAVLIEEKPIVVS